MGRQGARWALTKPPQRVLYLARGCRRMGAVVMIFEVSICWCSTVVTAVGCSDALEPGGSRGVVFLPLWAVLVGYHSLSAEGVSVRWGSLKG